MESSLLAIKKAFSRPKRKIHPAILILSVLVIVGLLWSGGPISKPYVNHKHNEILSSMNEAYESYIKAGDELNELLTHGISEQSMTDIQLAKQRILLAEQTFQNAKIHKLFGEFHEIATTSFVLQNEILNTLQSKTTQNEQSITINESILKLNSNAEYAKVSIRNAFEKNRLKYAETDNGFVFWYYGDEKRKPIKFN